LKSAKQINVLLEGNKLLLSSYRENIFWSGILLAYYGVLRWDSSLQGDPSLHHTGLVQKLHGERVCEPPPAVLLKSTAEPRCLSARQRGISWLRWPGPHPLCVFVSAECAEIRQVEITLNGRSLCVNLISV